MPRIEEDEKGLSRSTPKKPVTSEDEANFFSILTFWWVGGLLWRGFKNPLEESDLPTMPAEYGCDVGNIKFQQGWDKISNGNTKRPSRFQLFSLLCKVVGWKPWVKAITCVILYISTNFFLLMFLLRRLVNFLRGSGEWDGAGWLYVGGMILVLIIQSIAFHNQFMYATLIGTIARGTLLHAIYKKASRLAVVSNTGGIVNLQSADTYRVYEFFRFMHFLYITPIYGIISTIFLCMEIGPGSGFAAMGLVFLLLPLQMVMGKKTTSLRKTTVPITDERVSIMHEILGYIRLVKLYNWESSFSQTTQGIRKNEVKGLRSMLFVKGINNAITLWITPTAIFVAFAVYTSLGNTIDPALAFTVMVIINTMKVLTTIVPLSIKSTAELLVTLTRLLDYLCLEEGVDSRDYKPKSDKKEVVLKDVTFQYEKKLLSPMEQREKAKHLKKMKKKKKQVIMEELEEVPFAMNNLNIRVKKGELIAVVGSVGSGKSTFLQGILGSVPFNQGEVRIRGSLCYVPQQPWLLNETLKTNILFNKKYKEKRYINTLEACQLLPDIEILPGGEMTEIGEKGVNLSGGQKQRISLARAVYANRDIYLIDDTLSAVDQYVGNAIFNQVIKGTLKDKTILFVTNQLQYVSRCDKVLYLVDGKVQESGTFKELMASKGEFANMMKEHASENSNLVTAKKVSRSKSTVEILRGTSKSGNLTKEEGRSKGELGGYVLKEYIKEGGILLLLFSLLFFLASQAALVLFDYYFSYYIDQSNNPSNTRTNNYFISIWWCFLGALGICLVFRFLIYAVFTLNAATNIHNKVFKKVLRAPMSFFDATPLGRIINRFTKDQDNIDDLLFDAAHQTLNAALVLLSTIILIITVLWYFAVAIIPIGVLFWLIASFFRKSSRELKRLEGITRSPIFSHLSATLHGITAIKAYGAVRNFEKINIQRVDINTNVLILWEIASRWLALRLDFISVLIVTVTCIVAVVMRNTVDVSLLSLCVVYSLQTMGLLQWGLRVFTEAESLMTSVERLLEYSNKLEQEAPGIIKDNRPPKDWPVNPSIKFKNLEIRYSPESDPALQNLTFKIEAYHKVGIVGRTGSGKSTTVSSLFRLVEPSRGKIYIDGVNILKLGLDDVRSKLAIVPQDPVLFKATLRYNLDPFGYYGDEEIWDALNKVNIKQTVMKFPNQLDHLVEENGDNFSSGQKQLLCIARAILRKAKILILDEATASIDMETDEIIQKTIRSSFNHCTVLTIAHRLHTVIDGDKILFLDKGEILEYDTPKNLLNDPESEFSKLVNETGPEMSRYLRAVANGEMALYESAPPSMKMIA